MVKLVVVLVIVFSIVMFVSHFFSGNKIQQYIQRRGGLHVSTETEFFSKSSAQVVKYHDKHGNLRRVTFYENGLLSSFGDDEIIEYSTSSPEYRKIEKQERNAEKKNWQHEKQFYKIKEGELVIKQEFTYPNKNEIVYLNDDLAPNGKYKIGFMSYVIVEDGKVKELTMI